VYARKRNTTAKVAGLGYHSVDMAIHDATQLSNQNTDGEPTETLLRHPVNFVCNKTATGPGNTTVPVPDTALVLCR